MLDSVGTDCCFEETPFSSATTCFELIGWIKNGSEMVNRKKKNWNKSDGDVTPTLWNHPGCSLRALLRILLTSAISSLSLPSSKMLGSSSARYPRWIKRVASPVCGGGRQDDEEEKNQIFFLEKCASRSEDEKRFWMFLTTIINDKLGSFIWAKEEGFPSAFPIFRKLLVFPGKNWDSCLSNGSSSMILSAVAIFCGVKNQFRNRLFFLKEKKKKNCKFVQRKAPLSIVLNLMVPKTSTTKMRKFSQTWKCCNWPISQRLQGEPKSQSRLQFGQSCEESRRREHPWEVVWNHIFHELP